MILQARNLSWSAGGVEIVRGVDLEVAEGEFLGVIGPNGSGKTSLLSLLAGIRAPREGTVDLEGRRITTLTRRAVAQSVAVVEQQAETGERITAREAVRLGRTPHLSLLAPFGPRDEAIVDRALAEVEMTGFANRQWHTLSGGERQRLHIARALAQEPRILVLDEPTNHLDIHHQIALLGLVRSQPLTVVAALHDLNHAAMFCDRIAVMDAGRLVALGPPARILTADLLARVFKVEARVETDAAGGCVIRYARPTSARGRVGCAFFAAPLTEAG